jgi:hypothetical protein
MVLEMFSLPAKRTINQNNIQIIFAVVGVLAQQGLQDRKTQK